MRERVSSRVAERERLSVASIDLARLTREHPRVKRGASVRAAISIAQLASELIQMGRTLEMAFLESAVLALPTRIEIERDTESQASAREDLLELVREWVKTALAGANGSKKKS